MKMIAGKPLFMWTLECAKACPLPLRIIVTSDSPGILTLAEMNGVEFRERPCQLATDTASVIDVIFDAIPSSGGDKTVVLLQPTSPLRIPGDITKALNFHRHGHSVISAYRESGGYFWKLNGAIYIADLSHLMIHKEFAEPILYAMPKDRSIDIDTEEDFNLAEAMLCGRSW
jgi:N-acylneuraminate cytidylyltransferase/CMP-N,N'-diacetyllegionaminic acid synthase